MEIQPASMAQVVTGRGGRRIPVDDDVGNIARRIKEIDNSLSLQFNERGEFFVVVQTVDTPTGPEEKLVLTAQELDERVLHRVKHITHQSYDYVAEMDQMDAQAKRDEDHAFHEKTGEAGEVAAHALRKDLGATNKAFVPKDVD
jgi:hypothetical protein